MVGGAEKAENRWLREAMLSGVPVIYFLGVAPGRYTAIYPSFIAEWLDAEGRARLAFGAPEIAAHGIAVPSAPERRYALGLVRRRLHQATFREAVLSASDGRCAISGLPEPRMLDAAHIVVDGDAARGQPLVRNGLPMSKVHHAAFDQNLIGIDPDGCVHVSDELMSINDGPVLENVKRAAGVVLRPPSPDVDRPDRERLAIRFEGFLGR